MTRRIAMISDHASPLAEAGATDSGGQNVYVAQVSRHLARMGYAVDVFTRRDRRGLPEVLEWEPGVRVIHLPAGPARFIPKEELFQYLDHFTERLIDFFLRQRRPYDLVHANFWMSGHAAAEARRALGIPFVITFHALGRVRRQHQGSDDGFPDVRFEIEERLARQADRILAECPQDEQDLLSLYGADPNKIAVIPCGFDPQELWPVDRAKARRMLGLPEEEKVVLQLGRLVPRKGVDTVIQGFARAVRQMDSPARLVVVGGEAEIPDPQLTPEIGRLQKIAAREGLGDQVVFTGRRGRQALKYYYSAADVFVSIPWYEPFGITPVEAMACGVPVIGSNVGGIRYTVRHGETGFLIPPRDPQALADRLLYLFEHPEKAKLFGKNAIHRARVLFTWENVCESIGALYEAVIASADRRGRAASPREAGAIIARGFAEAVQAVRLSEKAMGETMAETARTIAECLMQGGKVLVCGNGGSAADAQHFASEFVGRFIHPNRRGLPVLALSADAVFLTAWSNDVGYEQVFARQVETFGRQGDLLLGISTSGRSPNLVQAFETARHMGIACVGLLGGDGGELLPLADLALVVPAGNTQRIQEVHLLVLHLICELVESHLFAHGFAAGDRLPADPKAALPPAPDSLATPGIGRLASEKALSRGFPPADLTLATDPLAERSAPLPLEVKRRVAGRRKARRNGSNEEES